jgi:1-acyl-sn-glycerol-3-phosphate acyltransferase
MNQSLSSQQSLSKQQSDSINSRVSPWLARLLYPLARYLVLPVFFSKIEVTGQENIPKTEPVIVAPTHRSRWDAMIIPYAVGRLVSGRDLRFMVSANEVKGVQGWFIKRMGGFPVDTERPGIGSVRHSIKLLHKDEMLVIFPEGGIYRENIVHPLKRGVARIALEVESEQPGSEIKILPISIKYNQPYPSWGSKVIVEIGSPLNVADYLGDSLRQSSQKLTNALKESLEKLHKVEDECRLASSEI